MDGPTGNPIELTHKTKRLSDLDIPGAGQVYVDGDYAYIGQLPNKEHLGTTIIDIKDPKNPKIVSTITLDDPGSHSHKARVIGDVMIVNHERNMTSAGRRAEELPAARARLIERLGRAPNSTDLAKELGVDEEDQYYSAADAAARRGRPHANLRVFDVTDISDMKPLSIFQVSEADSPWSQTTGTRFGAHQFQEHMRDTLVYCTWFSGGLRIVDIADPSSPREVGWYIPEPATDRRAPQTNDVDVDERGLVYLVDRFGGLDVVEFDH